MLAQPPILYGTAWKGPQTASLVVKAILAGFRGIDTACQPKHYNQPGVGEALRVLSTEHHIDRSQIWLQTKFTSLDGQDLSKPLPYDQHAPLAKQVQQSFATSLKELQTDYVDSLVLHSPMRTRADTLTVWKEFEALVASGQVRQLGISNIYDPALLAWAFETFEIKPSVIQNRFVPQQPIDFCRSILDVLKTASGKDASQKCTLQTFWTLSGNPELLASPELNSLAKHQHLTPAQALFRFLSRQQQTGVEIVPLNGTTSDRHMREDLDAVDQEASEDSEELRKKVHAVEEVIWR